MKRTFGAAEFPAAGSCPMARLEFCDSALELRWAHCSATADFLASLFAGVARRAELDENEARHTISYLANELLENAVKFRAPGNVALEAAFLEGTFQMRLRNYVGMDASGRFKALIEEMLERDPGDLLIERIEANAADDAGTGSGLGLLTLMNDYGVRMGWSFEDASEGRVRVETLAAVALS